METLKQITKETLIPIGLVMSIMAGAFWLGRLSLQVASNTEDVEECQAKILTLPTQYQYDTLQKSVDEVKQDVKQLLKKE